MKSHIFNPSNSITFSLLIFFLIFVPSFVNGILEDHKTLLFHHCSSQELNNEPNGQYMDARTKLFEKLQCMSFHSKLERTFVMVDDNSEASLSGLFQCRQDLDDHKCHECMKAFQNVSNDLCGSSVAARIQLSGCHVQYETDKYNNIISLDEEFNHKKCGENQVMVSSEYFEQTRSQTFEALESKAAAGGEGNTGFYSMNYEGFYAMAQCEVGLKKCDCAKCVVDAIEVIERECEGSIFGQVFLGSCYLSYDFNPHESHREQNNGANFRKIAAIAIGGAALLFVVFILFRCLKKSKDDE